MVRDGQVPACASLPCSSSMLVKYLLSSLRKFRVAENIHDYSLCLVPCFYSEERVISRSHHTSVAVCETLKLVLCLACSQIFAVHQSSRHNIRGVMFAPHHNSGTALSWSEWTRKYINPPSSRPSLLSANTQPRRTSNSEIQCSCLQCP
jgi:hypothetical protein